MRKIGIFAIAVASLSFCGAAHAGDFVTQPQTRVSCVRGDVWGILNRLAARIGTLELTAGCNGRHARHSFHYSGQAMDFRPLHASQRTAMAILRSDPAVGGVIAEGRGLVHVDTGRRMAGFMMVGYQSFGGGRHYAHYAYAHHHSYGRHYADAHHHHYGRHYAFVASPQSHSWRIASR